MTYPPDTRELLQLAAIALGAKYRAGSGMERVAPGADEWVAVGEPGIEFGHGKVIKPHIDNGDALLLAATLGIDILMPDANQLPVVICKSGDVQKNITFLPHQRLEAVRRAILLVAGELGRRILNKTPASAQPLNQQP